MTSFLADLITSAAAVDDIKDLPPLPDGTYLAIIVGNHEEVTAKTGTVGWQFTYRLVSANEDVNADDLAAHLDARNCALHDVTGKHTIYDSAYASTAVRDLIRALGINGALPVKQALAEIPGQNFNVHFRHETFKTQNQEMKRRAVIDKISAAE